MSATRKMIDAKPIQKFIVDGLNNPDPKKAFGHDAIEILTEIEYAPEVDVVPVDDIRVHFEKVTLGAGVFEINAVICGKPTVVRVPRSQDVVEVVRCKNCKVAVRDEYSGCYFCHGNHVPAEHYCSYGERRKEDGKGNL